MNPDEILEQIYFQAVKDDGLSVLEERLAAIVVYLDMLIAKIDKQKSQISVLVTSCLEKIIHPKQDIRYPRIEFDGGYSGRVLDTNVTTPFFKKHFPRYANKETGFLTMSTREGIPWTKEEGMKLKIRDEAVKQSFLEIIDAVEKKTVDSRDVLHYLFAKLNELSLQHQHIFNETIETADFLHIININTTLSMLDEHFAMKLSSRLPVIAIYSAYEHLINRIDRYKGKTLKPLNVHTSSDKRGYGDIEIYETDDKPFEIIEIKHGIPIDRNIIFDVANKSKDTPIKRYYVLTTAKENFISSEEETYINKFILHIRNENRLDIIANGIRNSLKYYLRFIDDCQDFIKSYTKNLIEDARISTEVLEDHIISWQEILKKHSE